MSNKYFNPSKVYCKQQHIYICDSWISS